MKFKKVASAKVLFGCFNTVFFACGFAEVVCGFLVLCDSRRVLLSRLLAAPDGPLAEAPLHYAALGLLAAGLAVCAAAALGCWATYMPSYAILTFYFLLVLSLLVGACAGGVAAAAWPRCAGVQAARGGAVGALQSYYAMPDYEHFTAALDLAQTELECCGMTDARNYDMSVWQLRRLGPRGAAVPPACCVQRAPASHLNPAPLNASRCQELAPNPEFRHVPLECCSMSAWQLRRLGPRGAAVPPACCVQRAPASHLNPAPLNASRCQELAPNPEFRHVPGCLTKLEDWYHQQFIVFMLSLFVVVLLKLGILLVTIFSCIRLRKHRRELHTFIMKSNKTNENIYETKMSSMHEEPVMAKYIQPNNFYSPRVRNPRIFHSKPNEMV